MILNKMTNFIQIQTIAYEFEGDKIVVNFMKYTDCRIQVILFQFDQKSHFSWVLNKFQLQVIRYI